jgi:hypothetical protein
MRCENALIVANGNYLTLQGDSPISGNPPTGKQPTSSGSKTAGSPNTGMSSKDEATREESKGGLPMFKAEFPS